MIAIGCDHGALELKEQLIEHLKKRGIECRDYGTYTKDSCDYPVYARKVAEAVLSGECEEGILLCGTGIGMSMVANRHNHIRGALCTKPFQAEMAKKHNNANLLILQGRNKCASSNKRILKRFLNTEFEGERHQIRIDMFSQNRTRPSSQNDIDMEGN